MDSKVQHETRPAARLLTPKQAAEFLSVPEGTLAQWRSQSRGPVFVKLEGRLVRYRARDLENYIAGRVVEPALDGGMRGNRERI
jgi:predicted DNA-binding transcriptional regulator AlpA